MDICLLREQTISSFPSFFKFVSYHWPSVLWVGITINYQDYGTTTIKSNMKCLFIALEVKKFFKKEVYMYL